MADDQRSLLERLRALQGASQGTPNSQLGLQQAMQRMQHRMNTDPPADGPPPMAQPMPDDNRPPGVGAPTPQDRAAQIAAVAQMNAQIKAKDDAMKAGNQQQDAMEAADMKRQNQPEYAEGGMIKFPKLKKRFEK